MKTVKEILIQDDTGSDLIVQVLPSMYVLPHRAHVVLSYDIWAKPGIAEAVGKAIQHVFDNPTVTVPTEGEE